MPSHVARSDTSWRETVRKSAAILVALALFVTGLVSIQLLTAPKAMADEWPDWGGVGTVQGYVFVDKTGSVDVQDSGDTPLAGVKINAMLVKADGTVIMDRDAERHPIPLSVTTHADGSYHFGFAKLIAEAYGPSVSNSQKRITRGDRIRVWVDPSNYKSGGPLHGMTPKIIKGGERLTEITTKNLSFLGMTNWIQGSISNVNMSFRPDTKFDGTAVDADGYGSHLPENKWKPTLKHEIPRGNPGSSSTADVDSNQPYLCGLAYSDVEFPYDIVNSGQSSGMADASSNPDKVIPGVRVVVTAYNTDSSGNPTTPRSTRYDYSDANGRWCVKWDNLKEIKPNRGVEPQFLVTLEPAKDKTEFESDITKLKDQPANQGITDYDSLTYVPRGANGIIEGYGSVGINGWYGTVRPIFNSGYSSVGHPAADPTCGIRYPYCLPNLRGVSTDDKFAAETAEMGLIPGTLEATYSRYSQETGTARDVTVTLNNRNQLDAAHKVIMVPVGEDPKTSDNWISSEVFTGNSYKFQVPADVPVGNYDLYLYSADLMGNILWNQLQDVDSYRVTDTTGHYYESQDTRDAELAKIRDDQSPAASVSEVYAGTTLWGAYEDLGEGSHTVSLVGAKDDTVYAENLVTGLKSEIDNPDAANPGDRVWKSYTGKDDSFTIPVGVNPGNYRLQIKNSYGEVVDYQPLRILPPVMNVDPNEVLIGKAVTVTLQHLDPTGSYKVVFTPEKPGPNAQPIEVPVGVVPANGEAAVKLEIPANLALAGKGKVTLVKDNPKRVQAVETLLVLKSAFHGLNIILPDQYVFGNSYSGYLGDSITRPTMDSCSGESCMTKFRLPEGTRIYNVSDSAMASPTFRIYAMNETTKEMIHGSNDAGRYKWSFKVMAYTRDGKDWSSLLYGGPDITGRAYWDNKPDRWYFNRPGAGSAYYEVTMTVTDTQTQQFDTKKFIVYPRNNVYDDYGYTDNQGFLGFGAILEVNEPVPNSDSNRYCYKTNYKDRWADIHKPNPDGSDQVYNKNPEKYANPYWTGLDWDNFQKGNDYYACLRGTPTKTTPNGDFYPFVSWAKYRDQYDDPANVVPAYIAIRDTKPPVITANSNGKAIKNGDTVTITQGDASIPLVAQATDNYILAKDDGLSNGFSVEAPDIDQQIGGRPTTNLVARVSDDNSKPEYHEVKTISLDFTGISVPRDVTPGVYPITFTATDRQSNLAKPFVINLKVEKKIVPPVFEATAPPAGKVGTAYSWQIPVTDGDAAAGGKITNVEVIGGTLPPGLSIVPKKTGYYLIANKPSAEGTYKFKLEATDNDGATASHEYSIEIAPPPMPKWDNPEDEVIEIPVEQPNYAPGANPDDNNAETVPWFTALIKPDEGYTPTYGSQIETVPQGQTATSMPEGLEFVDGHIVGVAKKVDEVGTTYVLKAFYGEDPSRAATKRVTIKVTDKVAPVVEKIKSVSYKVSHTVNLRIDASDNSGDPVTLHNLKCVKEGTTDELRLSIQGMKITSQPLINEQIGNYNCEVTVSDGHNTAEAGQWGNSTTETFRLRVRAEGPEIEVDPSSQNIKMTAASMPITPISVNYLEDGATIDPKDCQDKFPKTITWNEDNQEFTGTVTSLVDNTYQCTLTATGTDGKKTNVPLSIKVDGPLSSDSGLNAEGKLVLTGIVGRPLNQAEGIKVDADVTLSEGNMKTALASYFPATGQGALVLKSDSTNGAKITGTPTAATPGAVDFNLEIEGTDSNNKAYTINLPVKVTINPEPVIQDIPSEAIQESKFTPRVENPVSGENYTVQLFKDAALTQNIGEPVDVGKEMTVPLASQGTGGKVYVKAVVKGTETRVKTNTDSITITPIDIVLSDGKPLSSTAQGGTSYGMKGVGLLDNTDYQVKLCKASTKPLECTEVASITKTNPGFTLKVPVIGGEGADANNKYQIQLVDKANPSEPKVTKTFTSYAGTPDASQSTVTGPSESSVVGDTANPQVITVVLKDANGNPVPNQNGNLGIKGQLPAGMKVSSITAKDGQPGTYEIKIDSTLAATQQVQVTLNGKDLKAPVSVTFTNAAADASKSSALVAKTGAAAGGTEQNIIQVTLRDRFGNPVSNYKFDIGKDEPGRPDYEDKREIMMGFAYRYPIADWKAVVNKGNGVYNFPITSIRPGDVIKIKMKLNDGTVINPDSPLSVNFNFGTPSAENSTIKIEPKSGSGTTTPLPVVPQSKYDEFMKTATVPSGIPPEYANMFKTSMLLNNQEFTPYIYKVTVNMKDANGNGMPGMAGHGFRVVEPSEGVILDGTPEGVRETPGKPGEYVFYVASLKSGDFKVKVECTPVQFFAPAKPDLIASFKAGEPDSATFNLSSTSFTSGQEVNKPGTFVVKDENGNPVAKDTKVYVEVPGNKTLQEVTLGEGGVGTVPGFTPGLVTDNVLKVFKGATSDTKLLGSVELEIATGAPDAAKTEFTANPTEPIAFEGTVTLSGTVRDAAGNPIKNKPMTIELPDGGTIAVVTDNEGVLKPSGSQPLTFVAGAPAKEQIAKLYVGLSASGDALKQASVTPKKNPDKDGVPVKDGTKRSTVEIDQGTNIDNGETTTGTVLAAGDNEHYYTVTVKLKDTYGDAITGAADKLSITTSTEGFKPEGEGKNITFFGDFTESTDNPGTYTVKVQSSHVGTAILQVAYNKDGYTLNPQPIIGNVPTNNISATFKAGEVDSTNSVLEVREGNDVAPSGVAGNTYTAVFIPKDEYGHVLDIEGPVNLGDDSLTNRKWPLEKDPNTNEWKVSSPMLRSGEATMKIYIGDSTEPVKTGKFKVDPGKPSVTLADGAPEGAKATEFTQPGVVKRDDKDKFVSITRLNDAYGNKASKADRGNMTAKISVDGAAFADATVTDQGGALKVAIPTATEGDKIIQFYYNGKAFGDPITVNVSAKTAGVLDPATSTYNVTPTGSKPADGQASFTVNITLKDRDQKPLNPDLSKITLTKTMNVVGRDDEVVISNVEKTGDGTYRATVTSTLADSITIKVKVNGTDIALANNGNAVAKFTALAPAKVNLNYLKGKTVTSGDSVPTESVLVTDTHGNPVEQGTKVWVKVPGKSDPVELTADLNGYVKIPAFTAGKIDDNKVTAYGPDSTGNAADTSKNIGEQSFTVNPGSPSSATFSANGQKMTTTPVEFNNVTIMATVYDAAGNKVAAGHKVTVKLPDGTTIAAVTAADGTIVKTESGPNLNFKAGAQGVSQTVTLYAGEGTSGTALNSIQVTPVKDPAKQGVPVFGEGQSSASISDGLKVANNDDSFIVTVKLKDVYGDPVTGKAANLVLANFAEGFVTSGEGQNLTLGGFTEVGVSKSGMYTAVVKSTKAGTVNLTASYKHADNTAEVIRPASLVGQFIAGPFDKEKSLVQVFDSASNPTNQVAAGESVTVKVTPTDKFGNPVTLTDRNLTATVPGVTGDVTLQKQSDGTYQATVEPTRPAAAGSNVTFAAGPMQGRTAPLEVVVGSAASAKFKNADGTKNIAALTGVVGDTNDSPITVEVRDSEGNLLPDGRTVWLSIPGKSERVQATISGGKGIAQIPVSEADFKFKAEAQSISVYATQDGANALATLPVNGAVGAPTQATLVADPVNPVEYSIYKVTGQVKDKNGNLVKNGKFTMVVTDGDSPKTISVITDASGNLKTTDGGDITAKPGKVGVTQTIKLFKTSDTSSTPLGTATISPKEDPKKSGVPVVNGDLRSKATISAGEKKADKTEFHTVTIKLLDYYGKPVTGKAEYLSVSNSADGFVTSGDGQNLFIGQIQENATQPGVYTVEVRSTKVGTAKLSAQYHEGDVTLKSPSLAAKFVFSQVSLDAAHSNFAATGAEKVADGNAFDTVTVKLADKWGNPDVGQADNLTAQVSDLKDAVIGKFTEGPDGTYTAPVRSTVAGQGTVTVKLSDQVVPVAQTGKDKVNFVAGAIDKSKSELDAKPASPEEGKPVTVTGELKDANKNPVKNHNVTVVLPDGTKVAAKTDNDGNIIRRDDSGTPITFPTNDKQGQTLTVKLFDGDNVSADPLKTASVKVVKNAEALEVPVNPTNPETPANLNVASVAWITEGKRFADNFSYHTVTVVLKNKYGSFLAGKADKLKLELVSGDGFVASGTGQNLFFGEFSQNASRSVSDTPVTYTATIRSTKAGTPNVKAVFTDGGKTLDPIQPVTLTNTGYAKAENLPAPFVENQSVFQATYNNKPVSADNPVPKGQKVTLSYTPKDEDGKHVDLPGGSTIVATVEGKQVELTDPDNDNIYTASVALNNVGKGQVTVSVTESGATSPTDTKTADVWVKTTAPTIAVSSDGKQVTGQVDKGSTVKACVQRQGSSDCTPIDDSKVTVDGDGKYTVDTSSNPLNDGDKVKVTSTNNGTEASVEETVDVTPAKPAVTAVPQKDGSVKVTVTPAAGTRNIDHVTLQVGGETVTTTKEGDSYVYVVPVQDVPEAGSAKVVEASVTDKTGHTSASGYASVQGFSTPKPEDLVANSTGVTGTVPDSVEDGSTVTIYAPNGITKIGTGKVVKGSNGKNIVKATYNPGSEPENGAQITVTVTDKNTGRESAHAQVTVDTTAPGEPTIVTDKTKPGQVTGKVDKGDTVKVCVQTGTEKARCVDATVDDQGNYTATGIKPQIQHGDKVTVTATNKVGNSTSAEKTIDWQAPEAPDMTFTKNENGTVTIKVTPKKGADNQGTVKLKVGDDYVDLTEQPDGSYTYTTPSPATADTPVEATVTDKAGNVSDPKKETIKKVTTPNLTDVKANATAVTGKADTTIPEGSTVTVYKGSDVVGTGTVKDGKFTVTYTDPSKIKDGDKLDVVVKDKNTGVDSGKTRVTVDGVKPTVTVNPTNGGKVTGKVTSKIADPNEPDPTVTVTYTGKDGKEHTVPATVKCKTEGTNKVCEYTADLPKDQVDTTKPVKVTAKDDAGNTGEITTTPDTKAPVLTVKPTKGDKVEGTVDDPAAKVTVTYTDESGKEHKDVPATVTCTGDGAAKKCTYSAGLDPQAKDSSEITVTATDPAGNRGSTSAIADNTAPVPPTVKATEGKKGDTITGTVEPGSKPTIIYTTEAGTTVTVPSDKITVDDKGNFTYTLTERVKNDTEIKVTTTDAAGNTSQPGTYKVDRAKPALSVNPTNGTKVTGTTSEGATVKVTYQGEDGQPHEVEATVTTDPKSGTTTFKADLPQGQVDTSKPITVTATKEGVDNTVNVTPDTVAPAAPKNIAVSDDGTIVTGEGEPGASVTVTLPDGTTVTGQVDPDGNFSVKLPDGKKVKEGETVTVTLTDPAGNTSDPTTYTVDTVNSLTVDPLPQDGLSVTGKTDPGSEVTVKNAKGTVIGTVTAGPDGKFMVTIDPSKRPQAGDKLTVVSVDPRDNQATEDVTYAPVPPKAPQIDSINGDTLEGDAGAPDLLVTVCVYRDGKSQCVDVTPGPDGKFTVNLPGGPLQPGDKVSVTAEDKATGAVSAPTTFIQPTPPPSKPVTPKPADGTKPASILSRTGADSMVLSALAAFLVMVGGSALVSKRRLALQRRPRHRD